MIAAARNGRWSLCRLSGLLLGALLAATSHADDDPLAEARELFVIAYAAVEAGAPLPAALDPPALRSYALYPYLERARLERALRKTAATQLDDDGTAAFLEAHRGEPVAPELERVWLASLADRKQWQTLLEHSPTNPTDNGVGCQRLKARVAVGDTRGLQAAIVERWLLPERLPPACETAFDWLRAAGGMTDDLVERRVRALLEVQETAFARLLARRLPAERAAPFIQWADLLDQPAATLDALLVDPPRLRAVDDAAMLAAWRKLARRDPDAALQRYASLRDALGDNAPRVSRYSAALALGLAWDRRADDALRAFDAVAPADLDDNALAWQARAALWAGDWPQVERSIHDMSSEQRAQGRWRYWSARAAAVRGDEPTARALYMALLPNDNYYAASAAARLGRKAEPHPEALAPNELAIAAIAERSGFVRARELLLCGLRGAAFTEWLGAVAGLRPDERAQAIHLASRWQWHDVSVSAATEQKVFFDYALLYPRPYDAEVGAAAKLTRVGSQLIYGVIRQESLFRFDAVSSAGAIGLAQLRLETAREVARAWQQPAPGRADLLEPSVNITLGASHLRSLIDEFGDQTAVALAGYNAGEYAAERWLPSAPIDADVWIENIPFNETRDYVQRVLWHSVVFGWLDSGAGQPVDSWLAPVRPRSLASTARTP